MPLAGYTPRLCEFNCFNKNGLFSRDRLNKLDTISTVNTINTNKEMLLDII